MTTQYDREIEMLEQQYNNGEITYAEFLKQKRELDRDYQSAAEESAQEAYNREMERW